MSKEEIQLSDSLIYLQSKVALAKQGMDPESPMISQMLGHYTSDDHLRWLLDASYTIADHSEDIGQLGLALEWAKRTLYIRENEAPLEINSRLKAAVEKK